MKNAATPHARITGSIYLLYFLTAIGGQVLASRGMRSAGRITALVSDLVYLAIAVLFYRLFRPVSTTFSAVAALFSVAGCAMMLAGAVRGTAPVNPLLFFAMYCLLIGWLIVRSAFLPPFLGWLMLLAGAGWYLSLASRHNPALAVAAQALGFCAELVLMLWLIARGVDVERWRKQNAASGRRA